MRTRLIVGHSNLLRVAARRVGAHLYVYVEESSLSPEVESSKIIYRT